MKEDFDIESDADLEEELLAFSEPTVRKRLPDDANHTSKEQLEPEYLNNDAYKKTEFGDFRGYMQNKRAKLQIQNAALKESSAEKHPPLFRKLSIYINGYTAEVGFKRLSELVVLYGGSYIPYLDKKSLITHVVASNLTPKKFQEFTKYKVVSPNWILDSIKIGKLQDWRQYKFVPGQVDGSKDNPQLQILDLGLKVKQPGDLSVQQLPSKSVEVVPLPLPALAQMGANKTTRPTDKTSNSAWLAQNTSQNPQYARIYFEKSRLHLLSSFKEELSQFVWKKYESSDQNVGNHTVFHVDFDCFFVNVGLKTRPHLRGKPVVVCHAVSTGKEGELDSTSDVACASYEARLKGVKNGTVLGRAKELCPELQTIPFEFEEYKAVSWAFYEILTRQASRLQAVSMDEVYMHPDLQSQEPHNLIQFAETLRREILEATGCPASIGISHNILLAKLASRKAKPDGVYCLHDNITVHLQELSIRDLPGVGSSLEQKLVSTLNVKTVGELSTLSCAAIQEVMGHKIGQKIFEFSQGIDSRTIDIGSERKTVSADVNYGIRFTDSSQVPPFIKTLCEVALERLAGSTYLAKLLTLKVMKRAADQGEETWKFLGHGICDKINASAPISVSGRDEDQVRRVLEVVLRLLDGMAIYFRDLRGIGISFSRLVRPIEAPKVSKTTINNNASIFNVSRAKQISDAQLKKLNIDVEWFRSIPPEDQQTTFIQMGIQASTRAMRKSEPPDTRRSRSVSSKPLPQHVDISLTPDSISDAALAALSIQDPDLFRLLPRKEQEAELESRRKLLVTGGVKKGSVVSVRTVDIKVTHRPILMGASDENEVKDWLEKWVEATKEPHSQDIDRVSRYLSKVLRHERGQDLDRVASLISCLGMLIEDRFGRRHDANKGWWAAFDAIKLKIETTISDEWGTTAILLYPINY